jgi:MoaA/NifB/PqqE/SkfB family radical SAM enzyme
VDRGIAHQVEIHYNTNGTHYPEHAPAIWQHFKTVEIAISIDDVAERFEYQRTNAVWVDVLKNVSRFKQLRSDLPNIQLQCCITVNVFNIRYLRRVADWADYQEFDFVYWNIMHDAWYFSIATLPDDAKKAISAYLDNCAPPKKFRDEFIRIRDFMNGGASNDGFMLRMKIADLDRKRNQDFAAVCPEMANLINYTKNGNL